MRRRMHGSGCWKAGGLALPAEFRRMAVACLLAVLACAAAACSEQSRELEGQLDRMELLLAEVLAESRAEPGAVETDADAELERAEEQLDEALEAALASLELAEAAEARVEDLEAELDLAAQGSAEPSGDDSDGAVLREVIDRGVLRCAVPMTRPLFGLREGDGDPAGFEIEFCKAIAAAVLGDADAVEYVDASYAPTRFEVLNLGDADVLIRTTAVTASRDASLRLEYAPVTFYTGQGFAVRADSPYQSTADMTDQPTICVQSGTFDESNLADHFADLGLDYDPIGGARADVSHAFFSGACDVWTDWQLFLASDIWERDDAADFRILGQLLSKEPNAPAVRSGDPVWKDAVSWVVQGLILAEEMGITSRNVGAMAWDPPNWEIARLLGASYDGYRVADLGFGAGGGDERYWIDPRFIQRAIAAVGNYGEIYEREIGDAIPRRCSLNAPWNEDKRGCPPGMGGILYAPPYR